MGRIPPKIKRLFESCGFWQVPCLICGTAGQTECEHACYATKTLQTGMGAKQHQSVWSLIPVCRECNHRPKSKLLHWQVAIYLGMALKGAGLTDDPPPMAAVLVYDRQDPLPKEVESRARAWGLKLQMAMEIESWNR